MTRRDITDQLARAVERHSHVEPPDLHELAGRARRRRVRHKFAGGAVVCVAVLAAGLIVWNAMDVTDPQERGRPAAAFDQEETTDPSLGDRCLQRMQPSDPTKPPASDFGNAEEVSERFNTELRSYVSYAQAYWHSDGGMRIRIARNRSDTAQAKQRAQELINTTDAEFSGGITIEESDISTQDLRAWENDARDGLTYIRKEDIKSVNANELCQYVIISVTSPDDAQLTDEEREKYDVIGVPGADG